MSRGRNHLVETFFEKKSERTVVCNNGICGNKLLYLHNGNLVRHLKSLHPSIYYNYIQRKTGGVSNRIRTEDFDKLSCLVNQKHVQTALIELFTKCGRPLDLVEDQPFKIIVNPLIGGLKVKLNEQSVLDNIAEFSLNLKKELKEQLRDKLISLKIDVMTKSSESLLSVSVQFVKNNNLVLKTLAIKELIQEYSNEYFKTLLLQVLNDYNINLEQVVAITTDIVETLKVANGLCDDSSNGNFVQNDVTCTDLELSVDGISCAHSAAHTLQTCINEVLESSDIKKELDIIRQIMKKLRTEFYLELIRSRSCLMPTVDSKNNWTTTYQMLERFMELKDFIEVFIQDIVDLEVPTEIWPFAAEFLSLFKAFYASSKKLKTENVLYSDLYIEFTNITIQLEQLPRSTLKSALAESLNKQKMKLLENDLFVTAVFLDPRIKVCLASDQCNRAKSCILRLYTRLLFLRGNDTKNTRPTVELDGTATSSASSPVSLMSGNAEDALEEYFKAFDHVASNNIFTTSQLIEQDILAYGSQRRLAIKANIIDFWSKEKNALTEIAYVVLGIPFNQVSSERLSSAVEYLLTNRRINENFDNLEHLLLVRSNGEFVYN